MKIAVEGCAHGELDKIYETIEFIQKKENTKVDLLLICGDFQAVRNQSDLCCMAVPKKFQKMNTFFKYYSGEKVAPILTIIIGGNHEASNYMQELPYGGWLAKNIYYLGYASIIQFGGVRIGGLSGIYKSRDFHKGHYEAPPYTEDTKRSVYHVRNLEFFRMKQITRHIDVMLSHDWPRGIQRFGDINGLLRKKKFLVQDVKTNSLGSPPAEELLHILRPTYWFSAHLHVKFSAIVPHKTDIGEFESETKFLSLDKCLPKRDFLQILDIPHKKPLKLELDPEWLAILKSTNHLLHLKNSNCYMPGPGTGERFDFIPSEEDIKNIIDDFGGDLRVPENFVQTGSVYIAGAHQPCPLSGTLINAQTTLLCDMLDLTDPNRILNNPKSPTSYSITTSLNNTIHSESSSSDEDKKLDDVEEIKKHDVLDDLEEIQKKNQLIKTPPQKETELEEPSLVNTSGESGLEIGDLDISANSDSSIKRSNISLDLNNSTKKLKRRNLNIYSDLDNSIS